MVKPIAVIYIPQQIHRALAIKFQEDAAKSIGTEYWILFIPTAGAEVRLEVFFEKDFNQVKFNELKAMIQKALEVKVVGDGQK